MTHCWARERGTRRWRARRGWGAVALPLIGALALVAATPTPSLAAGWSPAVSVSAAHDMISNVGLASGPSGDMVFWRFYDLAPPTRQIFGPPGASYAGSPPAGPFGRPRPLPASYASGPLVALGGGGIAQLILHRTGVNTAKPSVAIGDVSGHFDPPLPVAGSVWVGRASLAGNRNGELLLAWISSPRSGHRQVWASVRLPGHGFAAPQLVSSSANGLAVTAAVGPGAHATAPAGRAASDMVVVFDSKRGRMLVRVRPHGSGWGAVSDIGPAAVGNENEVATPYIGRNGRIAVAWYHRQLSEGGEQGPSYTQVAVRPPDRRKFLPAQTLAKSQNGPLAGEVALVGRRGLSTAAGIRSARLEQRTDAGPLSREGLLESRRSVQRREDHLAARAVGEQRGRRDRSGRRDRHMGRWAQPAILGARPRCRRLRRAGHAQPAIGSVLPSRSRPPSTRSRLCRCIAKTAAAGSSPGAACPSSSRRSSPAGQSCGSRPARWGADKSAGALPSGPARSPSSPAPNCEWAGQVVACTNRCRSRHLYSMSGLRDFPVLGDGKLRMTRPKRGLSLHP